MRGLLDALIAPASAVPLWTAAVQAKFQAACDEDLQGTQRVPALRKVEEYLRHDSFRYKTEMDERNARTYLLTLLQALIEVLPADDESEKGLFRSADDRQFWYSVVVAIFHRREFDLERFGFGVPPNVYDPDPRTWPGSSRFMQRYRMLLVAVLRYSVRKLNGPVKAQYEEVFCLKIIAISFFRVPIIQGPVTEALVQLLATDEEAEAAAAAAAAADAASASSDGDLEESIEDPLAAMAAADAAAAAAAAAPPTPAAAATPDCMDAAFAETMGYMRDRGARSPLERRAEHAFMDGSPSLFCWSHLESHFEGPTSGESRLVIESSAWTTSDEMGGVWLRRLLYNAENFALFTRFIVDVVQRYAGRVNVAVPRAAGLRGRTQRAQTVSVQRPIAWHCIPGYGHILHLFSRVVYMMAASARTLDSALASWASHSPAPPVSTTGEFLVFNR